LKKRKKYIHKLNYELYNIILQNIGSKYEEKSLRKTTDSIKAEETDIIGTKYEYYLSKN
jgi:hypothetical protein